MAKGNLHRMEAGAKKKASVNKESVPIVTPTGSKVHFHSTRKFRKRRRQQKKA